MKTESIRIARIYLTEADHQLKEHFHISQTISWLAEQHHST